MQIALTGDTPVLTRTNRPSSRASARVANLRAVATVARLVVGGLFLWTSIWKLQRPYEFLSAVYSYEITSPGAGLLVASALPWIELVVGIGLVCGVLQRGCWSVSVVLLSIFVFVKAMAVRNGLLIACGCDGATTELISFWNIAATALALAAAVTGMTCTLGLPLARRSSDASTNTRK